VQGASQHSRHSSVLSSSKYTHGVGQGLFSPKLLVETNAWPKKAERRPPFPPFLSIHRYRSQLIVQQHQPMRSIAASFLLAVVALWSLLCVHGAGGLTNSMPAQAKSISFSALMQTQKIQHKLEKEDEGVSALSSKEVIFLPSIAKKLMHNNI
jgi:hypothetical protein